MAGRAKHLCHIIRWENKQAEDTGICLEVDKAAAPTILSTKISSPLCAIASTIKDPRGAMEMDKSV